MVVEPSMMGRSMIWKSVSTSLSTTPRGYWPERFALIWGVITLTDCRFEGNTAAQREGGACYLENSTGNASNRMQNCVFQGNAAGTNGGAVASESENLFQFINCAFSGNTAGAKGGAISGGSSNGDRYLNCSFSSNHAAQDGGALWIQSVGSLSFNGETTILDNCILWNNSAGGQIDTPSASFQFDTIESGLEPIFRNNLIENHSADDLNNSYNASSANNLDRTLPANDPLFITPVTPSATPTLAGDLRLQTGSPAIDVGDHSLYPDDLNPLAMDDPAGAARVQGLEIDLGAYETAGGPIAASQPSPPARPPPPAWSFASASARTPPRPRSTIWS